MKHIKRRLTVERSFSKNNTGALRAAAAVVIIFCHLNRTMLPRPENPLLVFGAFANLAVCLFFFYTGFNLFNNYQRRGHAWIKEFWLKKITRIYIPFVVMNTAVLLLWWAQGKGPTAPFDVLLSIVGLYLLNADAWYIQSCLLLYGLFYIVFAGLRLLTKDKSPEKIVVLVLGLLIIAAYSVLYSKYGAYKESVSIFPLGYIAGMIVAIFGEEIYSFWEKHKWDVFFTLLFVTVLIPFYIENKIDLRLFGRISLNMAAIQQVFVVLMANTLLIGENIESKCLKFIDKYSLYLYISHSFFYTIYRSEIIFIKSDLIYLLVYLVSIFAAAFALKILSDKVYKAAKSLKNKLVYINSKK